MRLISMAWATAIPAMACTCGPGSWAPPCEAYSQYPVVFSGTVLDHNDDGSGTYRQWTLYLVRVDERFRGLRPDQKEVFIDPGSMGTCYTEFDTGKQYLFFAGAHGDFAAASFGGGGKSKPFPARWSGRKQLPVYASAGCNPTRETKHSEEGLRWLRERARGATGTRVYGRVFQNYTAFYRKPSVTDELPLGGVRVWLEAPGRRFAAVADADGNYEIAKVPPGDYKLKAERAPWKPYDRPVTLAPGGCVLHYPNLESDGKVAGVVRGHDGKPVKEVRVELVPVLPDGKLADFAVAWGSTDAAGRYTIPEAPAGRFQAGVNLFGVPTRYQPYRAIGTAVDLQPNEAKAVPELKLSKPLPVRRVRVNVLWADGSRVMKGARAFAHYRGRRVESDSAIPGEPVELKLIAGYEYELIADHLPSWRIVGESDAVHLPAGSAPAEVTIRLKGNQPK